MPEGPNTLYMQKQQTEADIAELIRKSNQCSLKTSEIYATITNNNMGAGNLYALENWRKDQTVKVTAIKGKLGSRQNELLICKQNYYKILAKHITTPGMAEQQQNIQILHLAAQQKQL